MSSTKEPIARSLDTDIITTARNVALNAPDEEVIQNVLIIGAGQAGVQLAACLREEGFSGRITVVGEEPGLPYHRPPLSKAYLLGKAEDSSLVLRSATYFTEQAIEIVANDTALLIDRKSRTVRLSSGRLCGYDHLVLATGASNRRFPVPNDNLPEVARLRSLHDAAQLRARLGAAGRAIVVGAGFVGLEVAAVGRTLGLEIVVIEASDRPLSRSVSVPTARHLENLHSRAGVTFLFNMLVTQVVGTGDRIAGVETSSGRSVPGDLVLVGIGVAPNTTLAGDAGLPVADGIVVDEYLSTADPAISAIGDCAAFPCGFASAPRTRLESVQNAVDQARCLAARLAGRPKSYRAVPWFWSDQGAARLQIAGLSMPMDDVVIRGDTQSGSFSTFCFRDHRLVGVESVNRPADHVLARKLLSGSVPISASEMADVAFDLKAAVRRFLPVSAAG